MSRRFFVPFLVFGALAATPALADSKEMVVEIYRIAPGKHEEFLRQIALYDRANAEAGLPPRQLFVHESGAGWDFMLLQPAHHPMRRAQSWMPRSKSSASRRAPSSS
jgi:hypothetical protein